MTEQSKRELNKQQAVVSSRWNPTPEQLQILEELYKRGTRTPSTDDIQHITAQLRRYGKIEGKNVFYWFQNHKARERQKRRRQLESPNSDEHHQDIQDAERKELGNKVNNTKCHQLHAYQIRSSNDIYLCTNIGTSCQKDRSPPHMN